MSSSPLVTVIIATYNWSEVLPYSIGSVLRQTFPDFEVLVVGDGCTDNSEEVVKAQADDRVRWINLPANTGHQSDPNNEGLRQARGALIAYLGHDDLWFPHHLSSLIAALNCGSDLAFAITQVIGPNESFKVAVPFTLRYTRGAWIPPTGVAHRRSATEALGGWRRYRELEVDPEVDLWRRFHDARYKIQFVPRLTAIKFSASERPNIYRQRPHHEQEVWFHRIHTEPGLEAAELAQLLAASIEKATESAQLLAASIEAASVRDGRYPSVRDRLYIARSRMRQRIKDILHPPAKLPKGAALDARREIKGLDPKP